jgi:transposase InsO family protein
MIDTFSGWTEAFPTKTETSHITVKKPLQEIVPQLCLPLILRSDNGPAFTAKISKLIAKTLQLKWKLHCAYRPQSSGQVERINHTLKELLTKLSLETGDGWVNLLPAALLRVRCTPYRQGFTPFEILYGRPPPIIPKLVEETLTKISNHDLLQSLQALQHTLKQIHSAVWQAQGMATPDGSHGTPYELGDLIWVKGHHSDSPKPY